jgi:ABC-type molybdate transport system substrate-binding protein
MACCAWGVPRAGAAAELRLLVSTPLRAPLTDVAGDFRREHRVGIELVFGTTPSLPARVAKGERADLVVATAADIDALARLGVLDAGTVVPLGATGTGDARIEYAAGVLRRSTEPGPARAFAQFAVQPAARDRLRAHGVVPAP